MTKPNRAKIPRTSSPERRLSLGMNRFEFHGHKQGGVWRQTEVGQIFPLEVQLDRFSKIFDSFVQGLPLCDDGNLDTFGYVLRLPFPNNGFNRVLQVHSVFSFLVPDI